MELSNHLFWDVDQRQLNFETHALFIFERVANKGFKRDWEQLIEHYGKKRALDLALKIKFADRKTLNFLSIYFNVPRKKFRCYTNKQYLEKL